MIDDPGPYKAVKCPCNMTSCKNWLVAPVANIQGVCFTKAQAELVADVLQHRADRLRLLTKYAALHGIKEIKTP